MSTHGRIRRGLLFLTVFSVIAMILAPIQVHAVNIGYKQVDVFAAQFLIDNTQKKDLLILDVRSAGEFKLGHLQGAISIPFDQLESRINEIEVFKHKQILVYCRSGLTSQMAAEVLLIHGFVKVYDMIGGINTWMKMSLPIWTASHYVTIEPSSFTKIEPLLSRLLDSSTRREDCGCSNGNLTQEYQSVVIEQDENHIVQLFEIRYNNTLINATITTTKIVQLSETSPEMNWTLSFFSSVVSTSDINFSLYGLTYMVNNTNFHLSLETGLTPMDSNSYNKSFTMVVFKPTESSEIVSLELIEFKKLTTLSNVYRNVALVISEIEEEYNESSDSYHKVLAERYAVLKNQMRTLSGLVEYQLRDYDKVIYQSLVVVFDACDWSCWGPSWSSCYGMVAAPTLYCLYTCVLGCLYLGPAYTLCLTPCFITCFVGDIAWAVFCAIMAIVQCECDSGGGGGGGCPILSVYDGNELISEGVLDIHAKGDVIRTLFLHTYPVPIEHRYRLRLTEQSQNISHIDHVRLLVRVDGGRLIELELVSAIHSADGNVLRQMKHSDNIRIDTIGLAEVGGLNQYIDLEFVAVTKFEASQFIFVIEGFNAKEP